MNRQRGMALPAALMLLLVVALAGSMFVKTATKSFSLSKIDQASVDSYQITEGAVHSMIASMSSTPHLWRERVPLGGVPLGYTEYSQLTYGASNGIPTCSGNNCIRSLYPTGGGLVKNFGPLLTSGAIVDATKAIWNQLNSSSLPTADVTLNSVNSYNQVERLDESVPIGTNLGSELTNNPAGGTTNKNVRFRITGKTLRRLGMRTGDSTVVAIVEMPSS